MCRKSRVNVTSERGQKNLEFKSVRSCEILMTFYNVTDPEKVKNESMQLCFASYILIFSGFLFTNIEKRPASINYDMFIA